jgi:hypothetical protein
MADMTRAQARLPQVRADIGPAMPGWAMRVIAGLTAMVTVGFGPLLAGWWVAALIVGLGALLWTVEAPSTGSWVVCVAFAVVVELATYGPRLWVIVAVTALVYLTVRATWWAARVSFDGLVSLEALAMVCQRDAIVLGVSALVIAVSWWLIGPDGSAGGALVLGLGAIGLVGLGVALSVLLRRSSDESARPGPSHRIA